MVMVTAKLLSCGRVSRLELLGTLLGMRGKTLTRTLPSTRSRALTLALTLTLTLTLALALALPLTRSPPLSPPRQSSYAPT